MLSPLAALDAHPFRALTICRTASGWQASLEVSAGSFRIRTDATPSLALEALFLPVPSDLPPLPY